MNDKNCDHCAFRAKYDHNPASLLGRIWRWHINWCPGWKAYFTSLTDEEKKVISDKYNFNKYN